jgi:hypothetical protein
LKPVQRFSVNSCGKLMAKSQQIFTISVSRHRTIPAREAFRGNRAQIPHKQKGRAEARPFRSDNDSEAISALRELE